MDTAELINICNEVAGKDGYVILSQEQFDDITIEQSRLISAKYGRNTLIRLPDREIQFFEWLRKEDSEIWNDLWGTEEVEPYIVGISFLPLLLDRSRGFPICDLEKNDNFYFTNDHMVDEESKIFLDTARERFQNRESLTIAQLLTLEISLAPIDIWHFSFNHNISLKTAKQAVSQLVDDRVLVHLKEAGHIAGFVKF
jgi:hypothetical protein